MKYLLIICFLAIASISYCQDLIWKANFTGAGNNVPTKSTIDSKNNVYILSTFNGTCTTPTPIISTNGNNDIAISKYDSIGNHIWTQQIGGTSNDLATGIIVSPDDNYIYITGAFQGSIFGVTSSGLLDGFLAKYKNSGERIWFKNIANARVSTNQRPNMIKIDKNNNLIIAGWFFSEVIIGNTTENDTLTTTQPVGLFVAKLDTSGNVIKTKKFESTNSTTTLATFDVDTSGYYLSGNYNGNLFTDIDTLSSINNSSDFYIYKIDFNLNSKWLISGGGTSNDNLTSCSTDGDGFFYFGGHFGSISLSVDSTAAGIKSNKNILNRTADGKTDIFFAKYRYDGQLQWFNTAGSTENDYLYRALYKNRNFIAAGQYGGQLTFNNKTITPRTAPDAFAIVHSQKNYLIDIITIGGNAADVGETALVDNNNDIIVIGDYASTRLYFDTQDSIDNSEAATKDMFIVKYKMSKITDPAIVVCDDQYRFNNYIGLGTSDPDSTLTILGGEHITGGIKADGTIDAYAYKLNGVPFTGSGDSFWRMFDSRYATIGDTGIVASNVLVDSLSANNAMLGDTSILATFTDSLQVLKHGNTYVAMTDTGLHYVNCDTTNRSKYWVPTWEAVKNQIASFSGGVTPRSGLFYWNSDSSSYWLYSTPKEGVFFDMGGSYYNAAALYNKPLAVLSGTSPGFLAQTMNHVAANFSSNYNAGIFATTVSGTTNAVFGTAGDSVTFPRTGGIRIYRSSILNSSIGELNDSTFKGQSLHLTGGAKIDGTIKSGDYLELDAAAGMFKAVEDANNYSYLSTGGLDIVENLFAISFRVDKTIFSNGNDNTIIKPDGIATTDYIKVGQYGQGHITLDNTSDPNISMANAGGDSLNISPTEISMVGDNAIINLTSIANDYTHIGSTYANFYNSDGKMAYVNSDYLALSGLASDSISITPTEILISNETDTTNILSGSIESPKFIAKDNNNYHKFEADSAGMRIKRGSTTLMKIDNAGLIYATPPHAALYRTTDLTITADQNVWYKITGFTVKDTAWMLVQGDSIQIKKAGSYQVNMTTSFSGLNNEIWEVGVFKAGAAESPTQLRYTGTSDVGNMSIPVYVESDGDDWFSFKIRNTTDGDDPTIRRFSVIITTVHLNL